MDVNTNLKPRDRYLQRLAYHLDNPTASSPETYLQDLELELGRAVASKRRIYLDTKFWILMRDHVLGRKSDSQIKALYEILKAAVDSGRVICPVSAYALGEVQMQDDPKTRHATAALMDELSLSVLIQKEEARIPLEVRAFLERSLIGSHDPFVLLERIWTRPPWIMHPFDPGGDDSPPSQRLAARKAAIDAAWAYTIAEYVALAPGSLPMRAYSEVITPILNEEKPLPEHPKRKFEDVFMGQLVNPLEVFGPLIEGVMETISRDGKGGVSVGCAERENAESRFTIASSIYQAFKQGYAGRDLPFLQILPSILAMYVIDRERMYKPNDVFDFYHAACALPYSDLYLTEKSMAHLLTSRPLAFDKLYGIKITSRPAEAVEAVTDWLHT